jgi:hypothetical protein
MMGHKRTVQKTKTLIVFFCKPERYEKKWGGMKSGDWRDQLSFPSWLFISAMLRPVRWTGQAVAVAEGQIFSGPEDRTLSLQLSQRLLSFRTHTWPAGVATKFSALEFPRFRCHVLISVYNYVLHVTDRLSAFSGDAIATGYWLDDLGSIPGRGKRFFSVPQRADRL